MEDQIINEIRAIKENLASKYDYDLRMMFDDIARKQRLSDRRIINLKKDKDLIRRSVG